MEKKKIIYRRLVAWVLIAVHLGAIGFYIYFAATGKIVTTEAVGPAGDVKGKYFPGNEYAGRIMYCGYGFINSMFGVVTGIVLLLQPQAGYNGFLKIWIISAIIIMLSSFGVQMFLNIRIEDRLTILLLSFLLYGFALSVSQDHWKSENDSCAHDNCQHMIEMDEVL
ncbi:unnamed protein product [Allacma fusca]|uniref:Uncharacterized protein n=1 Tax=Allacma fusca TaxID=39272 RepID=A0A8J2JSW5_9HEXA|nr:unnamed protein product [Allacma fusca]